MFLNMHKKMNINMKIKELKEGLLRNLKR